MTGPITGPYTTNRFNSTKGPASYRYYQLKYKQTKPYNLVLPYRLEKSNCLSSDLSPLAPDNANAFSGNVAAGGIGFYDCTSGGTYDARFRAMQRLRGMVGERAEWLVNYAERKQAANMVTSRSLQLLALGLAVARRDLGTIRQLAGHVANSIRNPKTVGALWLEYHFAWKPMIQDIYNGIDILQRPIADKMVKGKGHQAYDQTYRVEETNYRTYVHRLLTVKASVACSFKVTNPNLWRANQLGLINPATVAWELVPFSFVVDWYIPVSGFLQSFTEWVGLALSDKSTTVISKDLNDYTLTSKHPGVPNAHCVNQAVCVHRVLSLPEASLRPPTPRSISVTRAATAISLLLQQLGR